jgi:hypothetical protein
MRDCENWNSWRSVEVHYSAPACCGNVITTRIASCGLFGNAPKRKNAGEPSACPLADAGAAGIRTARRRNPSVRSDRRSPRKGQVRAPAVATMSGRTYRLLKQLQHSSQLVLVAQRQFRSAAAASCNRFSHSAPFASRSSLPVMPPSSVVNRRHLYQAILDPGRVGKIERLP